MNRKTKHIIILAQSYLVIEKTNHNEADGERDPIAYEYVIIMGYLQRSTPDDWGDISHVPYKQPIGNADQKDGKVGVEKAGTTSRRNRQVQTTSNR